MANLPQGVLSRTKTTPIPVPRTRRRLDLRTLTSMPAGKMVPIAAWPLLREDRLSMSRVRLSFEMMETAELLVNAVNVRVLAYLVPNLAFPRFNGIDQLNRSYAGIPDVDGGAVIPFFKTRVMEAHAVNKVLTSMGKHARPGTVINDAYVESYNLIWNLRAANRSPDIVPRLLDNSSFAKAFWNHQTFAHIVPDFDQATIDGEVPLNIVNGSVTLAGNSTTLGYDATRGEVKLFRDHTPATGTNIYNTASTTTLIASSTNTATQAIMRHYLDLTKVVGELAEDGITVSLSNIELARKTQAFAALRKQYTGHDDDYIIDLLMNGVTVPEQAWRQPILLADQSTIFGMAKRYASDSTDLTASVVNGATFVDLAITTPVCPTGGVIMIVAEVTPEQLFERQQDPYLFVANPTTDLPEFLRDTLDPEKVEIVQNQYIDVDHATPTATFGYAPLNHKWNHIGPGIGGKFFRPTVDAPTDEDRQRIWAVETANPTLSEDFYLCTNMHTKPFVVTDQDPFEAVLRGVAQIEGNTVFGNLLIEASDDYETIMGEADMDRIDKPASTAAGDQEEVQ